MKEEFIKLIQDSKSVEQSSQEITFHSDESLESTMLEYGIDYCFENDKLVIRKNGEKAKFDYTRVKSSLGSKYDKTVITLD